MKFTRFYILILMSLLSLLIIFWYFVGRYYVPDVEDEAYNVYFIKKIPVFIFEFENPSKYIPEQRRIKYNGTDGLDKLAEYCHYRYGVNGTKVEILEQCGKIEDIRLPTN